MNKQRGIKFHRRLVIWIASAVFLTGLFGGAAGIFIFRNVLRPSQQQRIINTLPFMDVFFYRPPEGHTLPTPLPSTTQFSVEDLLNVTLDPLILPTTSESTRLPQADGTLQPTSEETP